VERIYEAGCAHLVNGGIGFSAAIDNEFYLTRSSTVALYTCGFRDRAALPPKLSEPGIISKYHQLVIGDLRGRPPKFFRQQAA
jgi:hypothetical protein